MKIELFVLIRYSPNIQETQRMVCEWQYEDISLKLVEVKFDSFVSYQLLVKSKLGIGAPKLIVLNNGVNEIRLAANQRQADLLTIIRDHNPDVEALLDGHVAVERATLGEATATVTAATKPKRL